jgi:hypothetical protein
MNFKVTFNKVYLNVSIGPENISYVGEMNVEILKQFDFLRYIIELESAEGVSVVKYQAEGCTLFNNDPNKKTSINNWLSNAFADYIAKFYDFSYFKCPSKVGKFCCRKSQERSTFNFLLPPIFKKGDNMFGRLTLKAKVSKKSKMENIFVGEERFKFIN